MRVLVEELRGLLGESDQLPEKYRHIDFKPPKSVASAAEKGLEYRRKQTGDKAGLTPGEAAKQGIGSGVQRAVNLKNRNNISPKVIKQMLAFFSRHEKNKDIAPEHKGEPWRDKGYVSWLLWGGDPGRAWAAGIRRQMETADKKESVSEAVESDGWPKGFDPAIFLGRWFMSKKPKDPKIYKAIAKKYPYKGTAFRVDESMYDGPYTSWSKTTDGLIAWKMSMPGNILGRTPEGWHVYRGEIDGIDLAAFAKGEGLDRADRSTSYAAGKIIEVEEVVPIKRVRKMIKVW